MTTARKGFNSVTVVIAMIAMLSWNLALAAPEGGQVVAGAAAISQSGNTTTINQASQNAVINWQGFNTNASEAVQFNQPNNSAIALNRITSGLPTQFDGALAANGHVWIVNPAGVVFGANSRVDVAGLVATTLNIQNNDFMNGNYKFDTVPGFENSKIINNGSITARDSGVVVLVAPGVENSGVIVANLGKVVLASGSAFTLDLYGDNLINFGTSAPVANGYVSHSGLISATGGKVLLTANSAAQLLDNVISMTGVIEANTATTGQHGQIILQGNHAGKVRVSGTLKAADGGFIETSGAVLDLTGMTLSAGMGGTWLIDPYNITVTAGTSNNSGAPLFTPTGSNSTVDAAALSVTLMAGTSVILDTGGAGSPGLDAGDITISSAISWTGVATLTLQAFRNITVNSAISIGAPASTGSIVLIAGQDIVTTGPSGDITNAGSGNITMNAARDLTIGRGVTESANGNMTLAAGRDFLLLAAPAALTNAGTGNMSITGGRNVQINGAMTIAGPVGQVTLNPDINRVGIGQVSFGATGISTTQASGGTNIFYNTLFFTAASAQAYYAPFIAGSGPLFLFPYFAAPGVPVTPALAAALANPALITAVTGGFNPNYPLFIINTNNIVDNLDDSIGHCCDQRAYNGNQLNRLSVINTMNNSTNTLPYVGSDDRLIVMGHVTSMSPEIFAVGADHRHRWLCIGSDIFLDDTVYTRNAGSADVTLFSGETVRVAPDDSYMF